MVSEMEHRWGEVSNERTNRSRPSTEIMHPIHRSDRFRAHRVRTALRASMPPAGTKARAPWRQRAAAAASRRSRGRVGERGMVDDGRGCDLAGWRSPVNGGWGFEAQRSVWIEIVSSAGLVSGQGVSHCLGPHHCGSMEEVPVRASFSSASSSAS